MAAGTHQPPDVPAPLWRAILNAGRKYNVPPLVLAAIWRGESGSSYPNPYVNSSGYGGLFGTTDWNGSTQQQADYAASIFHNALVQTHGDIYAANGIYATGKPSPGLYGHAGLPTGTVSGYGGGASTVSLPSSSGGFTNPHHLTKAEIEKILNEYLSGKLTKKQAEKQLGGPVTEGGYPGQSVVGGVQSVGSFLGRISDPAFWLRALEVAGGGLMIVMGLYLLARQVGLPSVTTAIPGPVGAAARTASTVGPSEIKSAPAPRTRRQQVVHHYHPVGSAASDRHDRELSRPRTDYDPATSDIGY